MNNKSIYTVTLTKADILNLLTVANYLSDYLEDLDVSGDFAPDADTKVTGWDLLTDTAAWQAIVDAYRGSNQ